MVSAAAIAAAAALYCRGLLTKLSKIADKEPKPAMRLSTFQHCVSPPTTTTSASACGSAAGKVNLQKMGHGFPLSFYGMWAVAFFFALPNKKKTFSSAEISELYCSCQP